MRFRFGPFAVGVEARDARVRAVLARETAAYRSVDADEPIDILVRVVDALDERRPFATNPAIHRELEDGFEADFGPFLTARWRRRPAHVEVEMVIHEPARARIRQLRNAEFHRPTDDAGKHLHELMLVGTAQMFFPDRLLFVHGSAMVAPNGDGVIIGGTGGVGKTSLCLELARSGGFGFLADDMVGVDPSGVVHLNASWPKIYAYNVAGDPELERRLLAGRSLVDRLHWYARRHAPSRVRRAIDPRVLHAAVAESAPLRRVYLVFRTDDTDVRVEAVSPSVAADVSACIIDAEHAELGRHARWTHVNRTVAARPPLTPDWGASSWSPALADRFRAAQCAIVRVPVAMPNRDYRIAMARIVRDTPDDSRRPDDRAPATPDPPMPV